MTTLKLMILAVAAFGCVSCNASFRGSMARVDAVYDTQNPLHRP